MDLSTSIEKIPGIGPVFQKKLKKLGIKTVEDLFFHLPRRYEDFRNIIPINKARLNENCTVFGKVLEIKNNKTWRKKITITFALVKDETGIIEAVWFYQPYLTNILKKGDFVFLSGKVTFGKNNIYFNNPAFEKVDSKKKEQIHTGRLVPIYPGTEGLSSRWLRNILKRLLISLNDKITDTLPLKIIKENRLLPIQKALWQIHFPESKKMAEKAKERFSFEELFLIQLFILQERARLAREKATPFPINLQLVKRFVRSLPFNLTDAQKKSSWQILKDLEKDRPMNRLLEGDVGSGKTVAAVIAALNVVKHGWQVAFMAPTEILAKQHFQSIANLLSKFNLNIGLLTGKQDQFRSKKLKNEVIEISRKKLLEKTLKGEIDILVGTHSLIQDKVKFGKLGLVILDEQHRFGVKQRAKLCQPRQENLIMTKGGRKIGKGKINIPHLLSMTATPIPRTLALTIYGDLDLSLIDELPKGRKKIITKIIDPKGREKTYQFIKEEVKKRRQAFIICPRIEGNKEEDGKPSKWAKVKAVKEEYEKLTKEIFPNLKVGMLHGKMPIKEKEKIMNDFKNRKINILVSTSVIEVGIDIPNATVMIIEGAERFGLAQLHQFRGRVGRAGFQSYCFLFTDSSSRKTKERLSALVSSNNGFSLAEKDLTIRGPGDFQGTRQWGIPDLMMDSLTNLKLVEKTREAAKKILIESPKLKKYPNLLDKMKNFRKKIHLE